MQLLEPIPLEPVRWLAHGSTRKFESHWRVWHDSPVLRTPLSLTLPRMCKTADLLGSPWGNEMPLVHTIYLVVVCDQGCVLTARACRCLGGLGRWNPSNSEFSPNQVFFCSVNNTSNTRGILISNDLTHTFNTEAQKEQIQVAGTSEPS